MIGWLSGKVRSRDAAESAIVLDVSGVGYELQVSLQTLAQVADVGVVYEAYVHTHVREDQITLFGFHGETERRMFRCLVSVPKVGPKSALAVLGGFPLPELIESIMTREASKLQKIPGIGKRTAEQIVLSLAEKLGSLKQLREGHGGGEDERAPELVSGDLGRIGDEAQQTLATWGWQPKHAAVAVGAVLAEAPDDALALEEVLRRAMRRLTER